MTDTAPDTDTDVPARPPARPDADTLRRHLDLLADHPDADETFVAWLRHLVETDAVRTTLYTHDDDDHELTPDEAWAAAEHIWLNGFACIRPSDEFAAGLGRTIISKVMRSDFVTRGAPGFPGSRAYVFWVNAS